MIDASAQNNGTVEELLGLRDAAVEDAAIVDAAPVPEAGPVVSAPTESRCRLVWGPSRLPFLGPGIVRPAGGHLDVTFHDHGQLRVHRVDYTKPPPAGAKPVKPVEPPGQTAMSFPACAAAYDVGGRANSVYCTGVEGAVQWTRLGAGTKKVGTARPNESLAAAAFGGDRSVVAFLNRRTVAGESALEAYVALEDGEPLRLSDDGAGATFVTLAPRSDREIVALMVDARTAMSPVHARVLTLRGDALELGPDVILYVGASERGGHAALARFADGTMVALLPMPTDLTRYALQGLVLPFPLQMDLPAEPFPYPKQVDFPRVVTATIGQKVYAALTRTKDAASDSPAVLEITEVQKNGSLLPLGILAEGVPMLDLDMAADEHQSLWLIYGDGHGSLLERRVCP